MYKVDAMQVAFFQRARIRVRDGYHAYLPLSFLATPLSELLDQVLGRFRHVLTAHYVVTTELQSFGNKAEGDGREQWREAYSANAVWSVIEDVTQVRRGVCSVTDEFTGAIERSPPELGAFRYPHGC